MINQNDESISSLISNLKAPTFSKVFMVLFNTVLFPKSVSIIIMILSQVQVSLLMIKSTIFGLDKPITGFLDTFEKFHNAFHLEKLITSDSSFSNLLILLTLFILYLLINAMILGYLVITIHKGRRPLLIMQKIWSIKIRLYPFLISYHLNVIILQIMSYCYSDGFDLSVEQIPYGHTVFIMSACAFFFNAFMSVGVLAIFTTNIKTKDTLASKIISHNLIDLGYKLLMPFFWIFTASSDAVCLIILTINLVYCSLRTWNIFQYLHYYKRLILKIDAVITSALTSFMIAAFLFKIISYFRYFEDLQPLLLFWLVLAIVFIKLYMDGIFNLFTKILIQPRAITNPYYLIHYSNVYKSFLKYSSPRLTTSRSQEGYLWSIAAIKQSEISSLIPSKINQGWTIESQTIIKDYFARLNLELLERCIEKNPDKVLLKTTLAQHYLKSEKLWIAANYLLEQALRLSFIARNSVYLIKLKMLCKIKIRENYNQAKKQFKEIKLDLQTYIRLQELYKTLSKDVQEHLGLQIQFWKDFQSSNPDYWLLENLANRIYSRAEIMNKDLTQYRTLIETGFSEPLIVLGLYCCFVQNDIVKGSKFIQEYCNFEERNCQNNKSRSSTVNDFILRSIYLLVSTSPNKLGYIYNCSGKSKSILGIEKNALIGKSINTLMPPLYAKSHDSLLRVAYKNINLKVLHEVREILVLNHHNNYLKCCQIYLSLNHLPEYGLCYSALLRPVQDDRRYLLIRDDGLISNFSKEFGDDLDIIMNKDESYNIFDFCPELQKILPDFAQISQRNAKTPYEPNTPASFSKVTSQIMLENIDQIQDKKISKVEEYQALSDFNTKELNLTFFPLLKKNKISGSPLLIRQDDPILYKAHIKRTILDNVGIIELKLEKVDNPSNYPLFYATDNHPEVRLSKSDPSSNLDTYYSLKAQKVRLSVMDSTENLMTLKSPKSPQKTNFSNINQSEIDLKLLGTEENCYPISPKLKQKNLPTTSLDSIPESHSEATIVNPKRLKPNQFNKKDINTSNMNLSVNQQGHSKLSFSIDSKDKKNSIEAPELEKIKVNIFKESLGEALTDDSMILKIESRKGLEAHKIVKKIINSKKPSTITVCFILAFLLTILFLMVFLIWINFYTASASKQVEILSQVLNNAYSRDYWVKLSNQEARIRVAVLANYSKFDLAISVPSNNKSYHKLNEFNQALQVSISNLEPEAQELLAAKNIRVYERDVNGSMRFVSYDNSFQVTKKIIMNGLTNVQKPISTKESIDRETQFIFYNSNNDLLLFSDRFIGTIEKALFDSLSNSRANLQKALGLIISVLALFVLFCLYYLINSNVQSENFMETVFTLPLKEIKNIESSLSKFKELLEKDARGFELLQNFNIIPSGIAKSQAKNFSPADNLTSHNRQTSRKASMKRFNFKNYIIFVEIIITIGLSVGFMVLYYTQALNKIYLMERQHTTITTEFKYINNLALVSQEVQAIIIENATTTVKNVPILESFLTEVEALKNFHQLQTSLADEQGVISPEQQEILSNITCDRVYSALYSIPQFLANIDCVVVSHGLGRTGLLGVLTEYISELDRFYSNFVRSTRNVAFLAANYDYFADYILSLINVSSTLLLMSFAGIVTDFQNLVSRLENERILYSWIAFVFIIILTAITWRIVIGKVSKREFQRKKVLMIIPTKLIMVNFRLKKLIWEISGTNNQVKSILLS